MYFELNLEEGAEFFCLFSKVVARVEGIVGGADFDLNFFCCRSARAAEAVVGMVWSVTTLVVFGLFRLDIVTVVLGPAFPKASSSSSAPGSDSVMSEVSDSEFSSASSSSSSPSSSPSSQSVPASVLSPMHSQSTPLDAGMCQYLFSVCCSTAVCLSIEQYVKTWVNSRMLLTTER
jgi:hypothetical protein